MKFLQFINKKIAIALATLILFQAIWPSTAAALTGGPSQPEVEGFKPVGVTDMVDLFTGDFQYNIPLLDIEGYPINLSYQSNPGMDEEASWVGLGWSLNPGVINRDVRGFPDDFKGDDVKREFNMKKDETIGYSAGPGLELFGFKTDKVKKKRNNPPNNTGILTVTGGIFYNTYRGWGTELGLSPSLSLSSKNTKYDLGLNLQYNTQSGLDFALSGGVNYQSGANFKLQNGLNSRTGLKDLTLTTGFNINGFGPVSASYGYDFGFAQRTYFPVSDLPLQNLSANVNVRLGAELIGIHGGLNISGYYSGQGLAKKKITNNAYGYLFHSDGKKDETGLLDYNKEKERPYRRDMPIIPMPFGTYDVFSATGQGVSGQFRATRNDVAGLSKARYANASTSASVGIELGGGQAFRFGGDVNIVQSNSEVVEWKDLNPVLKTNMNHTESSDLYESVFFKSMGENAPTESSFYTNTGGTNAVKVDLNKTSGKDVLTNAAFKPEKNKVALAAVNFSGQLKRNSREKRNQVFSYLDAEEATQMGLDRIIKNHPIGQITYGCSPGSLGTVNRVATTDEINLYKTNFRQKHHISEISVTNPDGQRYVYGIPAYNNDQQEVTFSVNVPKDADVLNPNHENFGLVSYSVDNDNSINNAKGKENYYDRQIIPSYAYAYLITGVLSPDYVDRTGDGITDDDLGNAVKFNYSRLTHQYQWRVPFQVGRARLQAGRKSDSATDGPNDDKGHYLYGKKEMWYVHSIESRNMVAQFYLSDREDAYGVQGENGGLNVTLADQKLKKLDSIRVFSKSDLRINSSNPTPIKTVIFEYDPTYPLCSKVPNNSTANRGKLTLKKVYFTYGKSRKGKLNAYVFSYGNNQDYSTWKYDRWGNYQNNGVAYTHNLDFPYTLQNPLLLNSGTWSLNQIILPSGGKINVEYEPDDYAYVQNRRATRMFYIEGYAQGNGLGGLVANTTDSTLYTNGSNSGNRIFKDYVVFNTGGFDVSQLTTDALLKKVFLEDISKYIFFKANVLLKTLSTPALREDVTGYFERDPGKPLIAIGSNKVGIPIRLTRDAKNKDPKPIHPITLATFQMMRLEMPEIAYNAKGSFPNPNESFFKSVQKTFNTSLGSDLKNLLNGYEQEGMRKKWAQISGVGAGDHTATSPTSKRSFLRLCDPDLIKYGGGSRVKKITISDEWNQAEGASTYGQEYSYRTKLDNDGPIISSGVASYEPINGGEENPLREPVEVQKDENNSGSIYAERKPLAPTNYYYAEYPIGESLFPAPVVGYSEVTVKNLTYANVSRTATGYSKHRFYTAKDFPVITDFTAHQPLRSTSNPLAKFLKFDVFDYVTASQGFVVETNDMHGKPESEEDYNESGSSIRFVQYNYKVDKDGPTKRLHNLVQVVKPDGTIPNLNQMMGVDIDVWQDFVEQNNTTVGAGIAFNADGFFAGPFPIIVPVPIPIIQSEKTRLRTAATTKLIKRSGILDNVVVIEDGSKVVTKNVLFDSETGNVLLTETQNEFDDKVYNLNYPAHWVYGMMGQGYNNTGAFVKNVTISNGSFSGLANPAAIFKPGDEVVIRKVVGTTITVEPNRYYITLPTTAGGLRVMDKDGVGANFNTPGASYIVKVVRSGQRNQASTSIGAVAMLNNPINTSQNKIEVTNLSKVINATALEFSEDWKMYCAQSVVGSNYYSPASIINPFTNGRLGNWRPKINWVFYQERDQNTTVAVRPRTQGTVKNFDPFWKIINNVWAKNPVTGWTTSNTITMYDPRGNAVETQNPIGVYASSQYGYNFTRVVAIADNAGYRDMAFEGFEETNFNCTTPPSLGMARKIIFNGLNTTSSIPHTGRNSAIVSNGGSIFAYIDKASSPLCVSGPGSFRDEPQNGTLRADIPGNTNQNAISFTCADCLPNTAVSTNTFKGGNQYNLSVWVATNSSLSSGNPIANGIKIKPRFYVGSAPAVDLPILDETRSPIIDGWMRIECRIDLTSVSLDKLEIRLENIGSNETAYFDDFRIHPWKSNMKSFVYDPWSMRLMAEMDENNYAMFYEYDDEGRLIRVKKETEKGVMTVKEARTQFKKNN